MHNKELNKKLIERREELLKELNIVDSLIEQIATNDSFDVFIRIYEDILGEDAVKTFIEDYYKGLEIKKHINHSGSWSSGTNLTKLAEWFKPVVNKFPKPVDRTWKNYLIDVILELGGEAKTSDIANFIILNNKDISFNKARQFAADLLPELVDKGLLVVEKGDSKKEGHLYKIGDIGLRAVPIHI